MADDVQDVRWKEFEELGEEEVRKRLSAHIWGEDKERLARQWLDLRQTSLAREANDLAREANDIASRNNFIAMLALFGAGLSITVSIIGLLLSIFLKRG